jgi:hypothetical protein
MRKLLSAVVVTAAIAVVPANADPVPHLNIGSSLEFVFDEPGDQRSTLMCCPNAASTICF